MVGWDEWREHEKRKRRTPLFIKTKIWSIEYINKTKRRVLSSQLTSWTHCFKKIKIRSTEYNNDNEKGPLSSQLTSWSHWVASTFR